MSVVSSRRRLSAPCGHVTDLNGPRACNGGGTAREWITTCSTAWRTAPTAIGFKIDQLPQGWTVTEHDCEEGTPGWLMIRPRGYVMLCDLAPAAPSLADVTELPPVMPATAAPVSATEEEQSARAALLALREENLRLRDVNFRLREQEATRRASLKDLERASQEAEEELERLRSTCALERGHLEEQERAASIMEQKLERCQDAVRHAVGCVDRLFALHDAEVDRQRCRRSSEADVRCRDMTVDDSEVLAARSEVLAASASVAALLPALRGGAGSAAAALAEAASAVASPAVATARVRFAGQENDDAAACSKKRVSAASTKVSPGAAAASPLGAATFCSPGMERSALRIINNASR
eukprot:TRINITY_DN339_c0_g2_i1.p1 TRINITY_DN339_c0_g2~~TRINITY_DN339_c0_g2_i1.p1  ORF type:complete len:354 (+),score=87.69 TRINITY_DN339_c0_g2_i1:94-1155(+)